MREEACDEEPDRNKSFNSKEIRKLNIPGPSQRSGISYRYEGADGRSYDDSSIDRSSGSGQQRARFSADHKRDRFEGYHHTMPPGYHKDRDHRPPDKQSGLNKEECDSNRQQYQRSRDLPSGSNANRYPHYPGRMPPGFGPMYPPTDPSSFPRGRYSSGECQERDYRQEH